LLPLVRALVRATPLRPGADVCPRSLRAAGLRSLLSGAVLPQRAGADAMATPAVWAVIEQFRSELTVFEMR